MYTLNQVGKPGQFARCLAINETPLTNQKKHFSYGLKNIVCFTRAGRMNVL